MNFLLVGLFAILAVANAAPSHGLLGGAVVGPAGIIASHGVVPGVVGVGHGLGLAGLGLGVGHAGAVLTAPSAHAVVAGPAGVLVGPGIVHGVHGIHGIGAAGVITNGGGAVVASAHGAAVHGPPTAPVVVSGPSGTISASGLWGPTANVGLGVHGVHGIVHHGVHG